ncbi:GTP pyrophosphokinase family protein [Pseudolactococcus yaeyamensis]
MTYEFSPLTKEKLSAIRGEYEVAIDRLEMIFEDLQDDFRQVAHDKHQLNPMMQFYSRCKTVSSMEGKLNKDIEDKDFFASDMNDITKILNHLRDIAATRILCPNKRSIFEVVKALKNCEILTFIEEKEKNMVGIPSIFGDFKEYSEKITQKRGYRSYHLIAELDGKNIEIQVRTYGMEFWGQLEHDMNYKHEIDTGIEIPQQLKDELVKVSNQIDNIDNKLYRIYEMILMNDYNHK